MCCKSLILNGYGKIILYTTTSFSNSSYTVYGMTAISVNYEVRSDSTLYHPRPGVFTEYVNKTICMLTMWVWLLNTAMSQYKSALLSIPSSLTV